MFICKLMLLNVNWTGCERASSPWSDAWWVLVLKTQTETDRVGVLPGTGMIAVWLFVWVDEAFSSSSCFCVFVTSFPVTGYNNNNFSPANKKPHFGKKKHIFLICILTVPNPTAWSTSQCVRLPAGPACLPACLRVPACLRACVPACVTAAQCNGCWW